MDMTTQTLTFTLAAALLAAGPAAAQSSDRALQAQERAAAATAAVTADIINAQQIAESVAAAQRAVASVDALTGTFAWAPQTGRDRETLAAQRAADDAARERERAIRDRDREGGYYEQGQSALDGGRWDRAVTAFDRVIELKGSKADAALYWKAYAQNKQGQRAEALTTLSSLSKDYPKSRYLNDAKALEVEVKANSGQGVDPKAESDEELKLYALNSLQNSDDAIPVLQKLLQGTSSPRLKARALFVLAQSSSPAARAVLIGIAKGGSNPDL
jgi:tetratricopeptide (TPR) repeat protein